MAFLAFAEPGMAGHARAAAARLIEGPKRYGAAERPQFAELERAVITLARADGMRSLRQPGLVWRAIAALFGFKATNQLADPKLEALRRIAVLSWRRGYAVAPAEVRTFLQAGYTPAQYELLVDGITAARHAEAKRRA